MNKTADTIIDQLYVLEPGGREKAKQALLKDILALIGEDDEWPTDMKGEDPDFIVHTRAKLHHRAELKDELRQKIRQYFGQDNQEARYERD